MSRSAGNRSRPAVSVIIPVYGGLQVTQACLESVLDSDLPPYASITIVNDNSPDPQISELCRKTAAKAGLNLVVNRENLGFVKNANTGFSLDPEADVILLNSDTVVSGNWVQRLQHCAYQEDRIGTVTPFSNNGTICSYPVFPLANDLPDGWSPRTLDDAFSAENDGAWAEIPTAVGFCMYIKRACLAETGLFDEENFGHGYGEECDFSLRASSRGWKNVIAGDVFVYHEGGASFAGESDERKRQADKIIDDIHPEYHAMVTDFIQADPLYPLRSRVDEFRLRVKPEDSASILAEHQRYSQSIMERVNLYRQEAAAEQAARIELDSMLSACRSQFEETDNALTLAQEVSAQQNSDLEEAQSYARDLHKHIDALNEHIRNMEQSRSWRYTAWMRKK